MQKFFLRDLQGVDEVEIRLANAHRLMRDERDDLIADIQKLSLSLFGITEDETDFWSAREGGYKGTADEWASHFEFLDWEYKEEGCFWQAVGIDVTDGKGNELEILEVLGRQLVCAVKSLIPAASLRFLPSANRTDEQIRADAEAWGRNLVHDTQLRSQS